MLSDLSGQVRVLKTLADSERFSLAKLMRDSKYQGHLM